MYKKISKISLGAGIAFAFVIGFSTLKGRNQTKKAEVSGDKAPNILRIVADDMGYGDSIINYSGRL